MATVRDTECFMAYSCISPLFFSTRTRSQFKAYNSGPPEKTAQRLRAVGSWRLAHLSCLFTSRVPSASPLGPLSCEMRPWQQRPAPLCMPSDYRTNARRSCAALGLRGRYVSAGNHSGRTSDIRTQGSVLLDIFYQHRHSCPLFCAQDTPCILDNLGNTVFGVWARLVLERLGLGLGLGSGLGVSGVWGSSGSGSGTECLRVGGCGSLGLPVGRSVGLGSRVWGSSGSLIFGSVALRV